MHGPPAEACVTVNVAVDAVTDRVPARGVPVQTPPPMVVLPTPGLNRNPAGALRMVVVPSASSPAATSEIPGPLIVT